MKKIDPLVLLLIKAKYIAQKRKLTRTFVAIDSALYASGYEIAGQFSHRAKTLNEAGKYLAINAKELIVKMKKSKSSTPPRSGIPFEKWTLSNWKWFTQKHMSRVPRKAWTEIWRSL